MRPNPQADLVTFTEEILNGKINFLCSEHISSLFSNHLSNIITSMQRTDLAPKLDMVTA